MVERAPTIYQGPHACGIRGQSWTANRPPAWSARFLTGLPPWLIFRTSVRTVCAIQQQRTCSTAVRTCAACKRYLGILHWEPLNYTHVSAERLRAAFGQTHPRLNTIRRAGWRPQQGEGIDVTVPATFGAPVKARLREAVLACHVADEVTARDDVSAPYRGVIGSWVVRIPSACSIETSSRSLSIPA